MYNDLKFLTHAYTYTQTHRKIWTSLVSLLQLQLISCFISNSKILWFFFVSSLFYLLLVFNNNSNLIIKIGMKKKNKMNPYTIIVYLVYEFIGFSIVVKYTQKFSHFILYSIQFYSIGNLLLLIIVIIIVEWRSTFTFTPLY